MIFPPKPGNPSQVTRNSVSFRACPQHNFKLSKSKERTCRNTSSLHNRRFMSQARRTRHLLEARNECEARDERWRKIKLYFSPPLAWLIKRGFECILILLFPPEENYFKIVVTEFRQAMTVSVRSRDLNDFAGSKVAKQTFFSRHIKKLFTALTNTAES